MSATHATRRYFGDWDGPGTGFVVTDAVAYVDSLVLYCWRPLPKGVVGSLRQQYGRRLLVEEYVIPRLRRSCWFVTIQQPKTATLNFLRTIQQDRFVVHAVHIATDFVCPDRRQAECATNFLKRGTVQKWRRRGYKSHLEANTAYAHIDRKRPRNIAHYGDRLSKTGAGACSHFELRFTGADACKAAGLGELADLVTVDVMRLLKREAKILFIDGKRLDRSIVKFARFNVRGRSQHGSLRTVDDAKKLLLRLLPRAIQDEGCILSESTLARARSQSLWDHAPYLRGCLTNGPAWTDFVPGAVRWWRWL